MQVQADGRGRKEAEAEAHPCEPIGSPGKVDMGGKSQEVKGGNTLA